MEVGLKRILKIAIASVFTTIIALFIGFLIIFMIFGSIEGEAINVMFNFIERATTSIYFYIGAYIVVFILFILFCIKEEVTISKEESEVIIERLKKRKFKSFYNGDTTVYYKNKLDLSMGVEIKILQSGDGMVKVSVPFIYKEIFMSTKAYFITLIISLIFLAFIVLGIMFIRSYYLLH